MLEKFIKVLFQFAACVSVAIVFLICVFLFSSGLPAIKEIGVIDFLFGREWKPGNRIFGIFPMIVGSIYVTLGAILVGVPIGILTAVFMAKFCDNGWYKIMKPAINLLAGIPSIIYGFFGLWVLVPFMRNTFLGSGKNILTASILLGIMILPTIINISETSLRAVPESYYQGAVALGETHEKSVFRVVLPAAKSGILAGVILGIGRAIGETMALIMVAGNQKIVPESVFDGVRTLTGNIVLEMGYATDLHRDALIATAVVLFVFILVINLTFSILKSKGLKE